MNSQNNIKEENNFVNAQTNILKEATQVNSRTNQDKENIQVTINANNLTFYSDKQWEEYDILTKLDGYELDYQDNSSGWIKVVKLEWFELEDFGLLQHKMVSDAIRIHKDGKIEHV